MGAAGRYRDGNAIVLIPGAVALPSMAQGKASKVMRMSGGPAAVSRAGSPFPCANIHALLLQRHARHAPLSASSCLASAAESPFAAPHQVQPDDEPKRKAHRNQPQEARMFPLMSPAMSKLSMCVLAATPIPSFLSRARTRFLVGTLA